MAFNPNKDSHPIIDNSKNNQIQNTFDLLKKGEQEIVLSDKYKDIILVFGNTGSGKSTFTQWISGNDKTLRAKEISEGTGEYVIVDDNNKISNSTLQSKTIFPELVVDKKTNAAYYDCPGFSDTRSTSHDISTTFFIKKVVDHAERVKMIFVVNHHSVRKGVDRKDFMELLKHVADLIKDVGKFRHSIAIVATKIDNQYIKKGKNFVLVDDDKVVGGIADFLLQVKNDLRERTRFPDVPEKEKRFYKDATDFIDILTLRDQARFPKIGIFRRPEEPGPLINISSLEEKKEEIKKMINENINFTTIIDNDFGYTISDKSKNDIYSLKDEINRNIWTDVSEIAGKLENYFHDLVNKIRSKIKSPLSMYVVPNREEAELLSTRFRTGYNNTLCLLNELRGLKHPGELAKEINNTLSSIVGVLPQDILSDIQSKGRYFNFLQVISKDQLDTRPWTDLFKGLPTYLSESERLIHDEVVHITSEIVEQINSNLNGTARVIREHYEKKSKSLEIDKLPTILSQDYSVLFNMTEDIRSKNTTIKLLMRTIKERANSLGISLPRKYLVKIEGLGEYFEYLQIIRHKKVYIRSFNWLRPIEDVVEYLNQSEKWYKFLNDFYLKFSSYIIQKDRRNYNVANIEDFGKHGKETGINITENNYRKFLQKIEQFDIKEHASVGNIDVTKSRLEELNHVLELTIKHKTVLSCRRSSVSILGSYITVKDILDNFIDYHDGSCSGLLQMMNKNIHLHIFALNSIFIDTDLEGINVPMKIISPKWEIIGGRKLELKGRKGKSHLEHESSGLITIHWGQRKLKANNGLKPGSKGDDGKPGGPGEPGPTFFGIGSFFVNSGNLTIVSSGGNGGSGQDGGDGYVGRHGRTPDESILDNLYCHSNLCSNGRRIWGFNCKKIRYYHREATYHTYGAIGSSDPGILQCEYEIFGDLGVKSGDGGHGGKGGKGGHPGKVILFELGAKSEISKKFNRGQDGECGKGGIAGGADFDGDDIIITYYNAGHGTSKWSITNKIAHYKSQSHKNGTDCSNAFNMEDPRPPIMVLEVATFLDEYKRYLRQHMKDRFRKTFLRQFYNELDGDYNVQNVYNTLDLVNEFKSLEEQFVELNKYVDFSPFYQLLLSRIIERANSLKDTEKSELRRNEQKKVLTYLYTASLEKIYNLKENPEFDLIIDINRYLDLLKTDIETLKDSQKVNNKLKMINNFKLNYKTSIDKKIKEAESLIKNHVTPEIEIIGKQIDDHIDLLIVKTIDLEKKASEDRTKLIEKRQKLKDALVLRGFFSGFKIIGQALTFLGPIGAVAGTIIGATSATAESLVLDDSTSRIATLQLPASVQSAPKLLGDQIKTYNNKKKADLDGMIAEILSETKKYPEILNGTTKTISDIRKRSKKIGQNDLKRMEHLQNELKRELKKKISELKTQKGASDQKSTKALAVVEKFNKAVQLCEMGFDVYNKYRNDDAKLNEISEAIRQSEIKFQKLKQFEEKIHDTIAPMLQNMEDSLYDVADKLGTKSRVSLDVTKWQVTSSLNDMKLIMGQLVRGFPDVEDNLPRCIEKLEEVMTTLIIVYDRINNYQEQQNLASYIADISSPVATGINITNSELNAAVSDLDALIRSKMILLHYERALKAFKQFVFPFAHVYLEELILPKDLMSTKSTEYLIGQATTHIEKIKSKVELYKLSVKKYDKYIHIAQFTSDYVSTQPFFVWKNTQYKPLISDLLSGLEVVMKADIALCPVNKDAIKFSSISFNFESRNDTVQQKLNDTLKSFIVSATHLGNSYYQYDGRTYMIAGDSQMIQYSFERNSEGHPVDKNMVYQKIQNGNLMLSPYALWKIKLLSSTNNISFDNLKIYSDELDLELVGTGSYVSAETKDLNLNVDRYYEPADTYNELEMIMGPETTKRKQSGYRYTRSTSRLDETVANSAGTTQNAYVPINYICNIFKQTISNLKNAFVHEVKRWVIGRDTLKDELINDNISFVGYVADLSELNRFNVVNLLQGTEYETDKITKFIDSENLVINTMKYDFFDMQGTLLLLNLIVHKKNYKKFKSINSKGDYAHTIAYNAYTTNI